LQVFSRAAQKDEWNGRSGAFSAQNGVLDMSKKFNPARIDKHAIDPKDAVKADMETDSELRKGLRDTFPASDPVSVTQPAHIRDDKNPRQPR